MNNKTTDVMIDTSSSLSQAQLSEIASQVKAIDGVVKFGRNTRSAKLIMVAYDAGRIRSMSILKKLTHHGFNASLVGI